MGAQVVEAMGKIIDSARKIVDIISEIAFASQKQTTAIHLIYNTIMQTDASTQQNSSLAYFLTTTYPKEPARLFLPLI